MIFLSGQDTQEDRWKRFCGCLAACSAWYTTVSTASSSSAICRCCLVPSTSSAFSAMWLVWEPAPKTFWASAPATTTVLLGRVLRAQPQHPHRVGRERGPQRRLHPSRLAAHRAPKTLWRLLHPPTHGSRYKLSLRRAQVSHRRSRLPYPPRTALPLDALLLLRSRRRAGSLTPQGIPVALMFLLFHKRVRGPLARSLFGTAPAKMSQARSKIRTVCRQAGTSVPRLVDLLAAA